MSMTCLTVPNLQVSNSICFLFHVLATNPDVQKKLYDEIQEFVGDQRPEPEHFKSMPYLKAVVKEMFRYLYKVHNIETVTPWLI